MSKAPVSVASATPASALINIGDINCLTFDRPSLGMERYFVANLLQRFMMERPDADAILIDDKPFIAPDKVRFIRQNTLVLDQPQTQHYLKSIFSKAKPRPAILAMKAMMNSPYEKPHKATAEARRIMATLGDNLTVLLWGMTIPLDGTNLIRVRTVGNIAGVANEKHQLVLQRNADGTFTEIDPVAMGKACLSRYRFYEVQASEIRSQLGRLVVPIPGHYEKLVAAGVVVPLDGGDRVAVNPD